MSVILSNKNLDSNELVTRLEMLAGEESEFTLKERHQPDVSSERNYASSQYMQPALVLLPHYMHPDETMDWTLPGKMSTILC